MANATGIDQRACSSPMPTMISMEGPSSLKFVSIDMERGLPWLTMVGAQRHARRVSLDCVDFAAVAVTVSAAEAGAAVALAVASAIEIGEIETCCV